MSLFPTKFVADMGRETVYSDSTLEAVLSVNGTTVLRETYSPAEGTITIAGLRAVLEAALYGELGTDAQDHAAATVALTIGTHTFAPPGGTLYASRLRNPRDPNGTHTVMAAGDLVAVATGGELVTPAVYAKIAGGAVMMQSVERGGGQVSLGDGLTLHLVETACPERAVAVRFLNRYDVPQTMMTPCPLDIKPGFEDQTSLMYGERVRYSVSQNDEYTLRSGEIHSELEYASWYDLLTSRRAEVLMHGAWLPILITKSNYTQVARQKGRKRVEVGFTMADPRQGI